MKPMKIDNSMSPTSNSKTMHNIKGVSITITAFIISVGLLNVTKWIYVAYSFKFPLFLTATHMITSYCMAWMMIYPLRLVPNRRVISFKDQVLIVAPFSLLGASSIACGNMALVFLYPSFHEMLQNTTPFWTVICSIIFARKRYNYATYLTMIPVTFGGAICAWGEASKFAIVGLVISLLAALLRALRAIVQANLMRGQDPIDSITLLFYAAPFNLALFACGSFFLEGAAPWTGFFSLSFSGQMFILGASCMAALYNLFAFLMVGHMGAVGSMVVGNLKTPSIIVVSTMIFGNSCTLLQLLGFICVSGGAYMYSKYSEEKITRDKRENEFAELTNVVPGKDEFGLDAEEDMVYASSGGNKE